MKKLTYLFLALLLPGLVFVFLKYAGSNRFDIPVYHADSVKVPPACGQLIRAPYVLPDSAWDHLAARKPAQVVIFPTAGVDVATVSRDITNEIGDRVQIVPADKFGSDERTLDRWRSCVFLADGSSKAVLFDDKGQIRGYYDLRSREETDRLRVELKILLEQY